MKIKEVQIWPKLHKPENKTIFNTKNKIQFILWKNTGINQHKK